ncbi:multidrug ABC transporter ATP-binding protein, partial [Enterococcus faecalis]
NLFSLIFGAYYTIKGESTEGQFVGFILLSNIFIRPIEKVNNMIETYPKPFAGFKHITEETDKQPCIRDLPAAVAVSH